AAGHAERDRGEEGVLAQLGHRHLCAVDVELTEDLGEQIMGHGPWRARALELHEDRCGLRMTDPDGEELVAVDSLQEHDRLLANNDVADVIDEDLLHAYPPRGDRQSIGTRRARARASRVPPARRA